MARGIHDSTSARPQQVLLTLLLALTVVSVALPAAHSAVCPNHPTERFRTVMTAPYTPFLANGSLNADPVVVNQLAAWNKKQGATLAWVLGGMGEYNAMSTEERMEMGALWIQAVRQHRPLRVAVHVGHISLVEARKLATHAVSLGADSLAAIPPSVSTVESLIESLQYMLAEAGDTPFYYYHIPGSTNVRVSMYEFVRQAVGEGKLPQLAGIKYVENTHGDFFQIQQEFGDRVDMMWAQEPKLQGLGLGATSFVVAEDYLAASLVRFYAHWRRGDLVACHREQEWKNAVGAIRRSVGGSGTAIGKEVLRLAGIELGPPRLPDKPLSAEQAALLKQKLDDFKFWDGVNL